MSADATSDFHVLTTDSEVLQSSHLVAELESDFAERDTHERVPVLIGEDVAHFHDVDGGYSADRDAHIVNLIHEVQGEGSPARHTARSVEIHGDQLFTLTVTDATTFDDYPDEPYVLSLEVSDYSIADESFRHELLIDIDRREQEFSK